MKSNCKKEYLNDIIACTIFSKAVTSLYHRERLPEE